MTEDRQRPRARRRRRREEETPLPVPPVEVGEGPRQEALVPPAEVSPKAESVEPIAEAPAEAPDWIPDEANDVEAPLSEEYPVDSPEAPPEVRLEAPEAAEEFATAYPGEGSDGPASAAAHAGDRDATGRAVPLEEESERQSPLLPGEGEGAGFEPPRRRERRRDLLELDLPAETAAGAAPRATRPPRRKPSRPRRGDRRGERERAGPDFAAVLVDRDDDLATVLGKIDTASSPHVALVTHGGNREMQDSRLTLRRIKRYGEQTGKDVVVVTRRWSLRSKARREGLRTSYMTRGIRWGRRRRRVNLAILPGIGGLARLIVGLALIFGAIIAAYIIVPSATVTIRPSIGAISKAIDATVSLREEIPDYELATLPGLRLKVSLDYSVAVPVTGTKEKPTGTASGTVTFTNPSDEVLTIPEGTRIKTAEAVVFLTDEEIEIEAGLDADVGVTALNPGDSGAVEADTITILEGELVGVVSVTNAQATNPSGTETVPAVSSDDLANLRTVVVNVISDRAMEELRKENPGALVFPETLDVSLVNEEFSHEIGEEANWITIDAQTSITALAVTPEDLKELARFWLAGDLTQDEVLLDDTLQAEVAPESTVEYDADTATVTAKLLVEGGIIPAFDPEELQSAIAGSSVDEARDYLACEGDFARRGQCWAGERFDSLTEPVIDRGPDWLPGGMPRFDWRIKLVVEPGP